MIKVIQLDRKGARLVNREPFLLPDDLQFDFDNTVGYDLTSAFVTFKNGEKSEHLKVERPIVVPDSVLFDGRLDVQIDLWHDGKCYKSFYLPPLQIVNTNCGIEIIDILNEYQKEMAGIKERLTVLEKKHEFYK